MNDLQNQEKTEMNNKTRTPIKPDEKKAKELILLLSALSEGDEYFGATKLNKLLFYTDFLTYILYGAPVTGYSYQARPGGPMLKDFYKIRGEMDGKEIVIAQRNFGGHRQDKTFAKRDPNYGMFTGEEMSIITHIVNEFKGVNAAQISSLSHEFLGWQAVEIGEEIPYEIALVSTADLTEEEWSFPENVNINFEEIGISEADIIPHDTQDV